MTTKPIDSDALVEDEWYGVRYSGEIPEVALHSAIHHLTSDSEGPRLRLSGRQRSYLVDAVRQRYADIILRDLLPANKLTGGYRGVKRSLLNWKRFVLFCGRYGVDAEPLRRVAGETLREFLDYELKANRRDSRYGRLNCSWAELLEFAALLELDAAALPVALQRLCEGAGD
ncbi:MAG: hypothetical protein LJE64_04235 [Desulfofustis sp.]|jgi:hypothetical protein|nr:hypothetical protein [Desulfofustis sp.]